MIYFDSAFIAKCYLNEVDSAPVRQMARTTTGLSSCEIARVEFASAVRRYARDTNASPAVVAQIFADFDADVSAGVWRLFPVDSSTLIQAALDLRALPATVSLRALDALHLTCAKLQGFSQIYTNDQRMLASAPHFGLQGVNIIP